MTIKGNNINGENEVEKDFTIILTIEGTIYKDMEVSVASPNTTISDVIATAVQEFGLPYHLDIGEYSLRRYEGENGIGIECLFPQDEDGHEMTLSDYRIKSGDRLCLVVVPTAGGSEYPMPSDNPGIDPHRPKPGHQSNGTIDSHHATGRNDKEDSVFDHSDYAHHQKHLMPESTSFIMKMLRWVKSRFSNRRNVNATVFAPWAAERGEVMTVQVLLYKDSQYTEVLRRAKMVDPDAEEKNNQVIGVPMRKGDVVSTHLTFYTHDMDDSMVQVEESTKQVVWNSNVEDITFSVYIHQLYSKKLLNGNVVLKLNDVPITEMAFKVKIVDDKEAIVALADICATRFSRVFISYSHSDFDRVQYISETCKAIDCDFFFDRHSLKPGDRYPEKIFKYIDKANLFILCWSENAALSKWVKMEREHALKNLTSGQKLRFYPISIPPKTDLPDDMKDSFTFGELK